MAEICKWCGDGPATHSFDFCRMLREHLFARDDFMRLDAVTEQPYRSRPKADHRVFADKDLAACGWGYLSKMPNAADDARLDEALFAANIPACMTEYQFITRRWFAELMFDVLGPLEPTRERLIRGKVSKHYKAALEDVLSTLIPAWARTADPVVIHLRTMLRLRRARQESHLGPCEPSRNRRRGWYQLRKQKGA